MNFMAKAGVVLAVVCSCAPPLFAGEGFVMIEQTVRGAAKRSSEVHLEPERMHAQMTSPAGETQIMIFDGPRQVLRVVNPSRKAYTEMTKADADRMGEQLTAVIAAMKEKLASLTPEQRAKAEAMMGRLGGAATGSTSKPDYRRAGTDKVGKWTCDKYEGFRNNEKVSEVCTVEPKVLGLTPDDFGVSKQFAAFFSKMLPPDVTEMVGMGFFEAQGFSGIPVRRVVYTGGKVQATSEVLEVRRQNLPDSSYDVPAGFQKQAVGIK